MVQFADRSPPRRPQTVACGLICLSVGFFAGRESKEQPSLNPEPIEETLADETDHDLSAVVLPAIKAPDRVVAISEDNTIEQGPPLVEDDTESPIQTTDPCASGFVSAKIFEIEALLEQMDCPASREQLIEGLKALSNSDEYQSQAVLDFRDSSFEIVSMYGHRAMQQLIQDLKHMTPISVEVEQDPYSIQSGRVSIYPVQNEEGEVSLHIKYGEAYDYDRVYKIEDPELKKSLIVTSILQSVAAGEPIESLSLWFEALAQ
ncbi:MAG: hypothetical protein H6619_05120 [Deltaproteobacteria bacterium]|nr:hypothetical protein [Deltaproteobacteria bacterium]